jgi:hypothetical protein
MRLDVSLARSLGNYPFIRELVRDVMTRCNIHRQGSLSDIFLISAPRSGSTWLMETIAAEPGIKFVNEPFTPKFVKKAQLPTGLEGKLPLNKWKVLVVPPDADIQFREHLLENSATRIRGPYNIFSRDFDFLTNRRVVKDVDATSICEWIDDQDLGFRIVYLIRHPISTALSLVRGSVVRVEANLRHEGFRNRYLSDELTTYAWEIVQDGSEFEKGVLQWCLDNSIPWNAITRGNRNWLLFTYEELLLSPVKSIQLIAERIELSRVDRLLRRVRIPSATTWPGREEIVKKANAVQRVKEWQVQVTDSAQRTAFEIVSRFGIDAYELGSPVAREIYLHFSETAQLRDSLQQRLSIPYQPQAKSERARRSA